MTRSSQSGDFRARRVTVADRVIRRTSGAEAQAERTGPTMFYRSAESITPFTISEAGQRSLYGIPESLSSWRHADGN